MTILKYGDIEPKQMKCTFCKAEFEYTPTDVKVDVTRTRRVVHCPVCNMPMEYKGEDDD